MDALSFCDVMVEGLAKHLHCVGVDAAIPHSKKPEPRELIDQAYKEESAFDMRCQAIETPVIEIFQLKISEDQLMLRCTKCNRRFIQKPLTTEEAIEAAKGFLRIPNCLFDKNLEF
ncbi:hypothetical protein CRYUN_Cryun07bG0120100 [Craigia yunnanensis]